MAESQVPYPYGPEPLRAIRAAISQPRFAAYMRRAGNQEEYACDLYLYNSRLAKAFLFPLNMCEVTLRNAVDELLVRRFGPSWHTDPTFTGRILTDDSRAALDKAILRAGVSASRDQIVATLTFDFWSNLFRSDYGDLWRTSVNVVFPRLPRGQSRRDVQHIVRSINVFRNRVAHHEPILDMNVTEIYSQILRLIELRCSETADWVRHHSTIGVVIRTRPRPGIPVGYTLASRADPTFPVVQRSTRLRDLVVRIDDRHPVVVCVDESGSCIGAFTAHDLVHFIERRSRALEGLVDLSELTVGELIGETEPLRTWSTLPGETAFGTAIKEMKKSNVRMIVAVTDTGAPSGTLLRAHRRY